LEEEEETPTEQQKKNFKRIVEETGNNSKVFEIDEEKVNY
jgi:hypothetical protein